MSLCNRNFFFKLHQLSAECIYEVERSGIILSDVEMLKENLQPFFS